MMHRIHAGALLLMSLMPIAHADIAGCWISEAGNSVIELRPAGDAMEGRVVGLEAPLFLDEEDAGTPGAVRVDLNNPEPALRDRPIAGLVIVSDLRPDGDAWTRGRIYDPESGNTYSARAEVDRQGHLRLRGYIGSPMFGRTTRWDSARQRGEDAIRMIERARPYLPSDAPAPSC